MTAGTIIPQRPLLRSVLFVPGDQPRMHARAREVSADAIILDLEDSVAATDKARARTLVRAALEEGFPEGLTVLVRPNAATTGLLDDDLTVALHPRLTGLTIPKVRSSQEVQALDRHLAELEPGSGLPPGALRLLILIETPHAVLDALLIASCSTRVIGLAFGADDLAAEMGLVRTPENTEIAYPRAHVAMAAHAVGVEAIDIVHTSFRDTEGFRREALAARSIGYTGKQCIHPTQIDPANAIFSPSLEEIAWAKRILEIYAQAPRGAFVLDERMTDAPFVALARKLLLRGAQVEAARVRRGG